VKHLVDREISLSWAIE